MHPFVSQSFADSRRHEAEQSARRHRLARSARPARQAARLALGRMLRFAGHGAQRLAALVPRSSRQHGGADGLLEAGADGAKAVRCLS